MARKLDLAPDEYSKSYFDNQFGKLNNTIAQLENYSNPISSGNGPPGNGSGAVGTFYIDLTNKVFYGPKKANGWGSGFSIV